MSTTTTHARGHVRRPDKDAVIALRNMMHALRLAVLPKALAPSYDCRQLSLVPPIVDQGQCGSCWDFSGTGIVTSALIASGICKVDGSLVCSEQYTMDCGQNGGCNGDDNTTVLEWAEATGLATQPTYPPYQAQSNRCDTVDGLPLQKISTWGFCDAVNTQGVASTAAIKNAMVHYGPIGAGVDASAFDSYTSGILTGVGHSIDHDIILVAWQDDAAVAGGGYWTLRNSWGVDWGISGYMQIGYGAYDVGTEAVWAEGPSTPPPPPPPGPTPPPPSALGSLTLPADLPAGVYQILASAAAARRAGRTIPAWLDGLLADLCALGPALPAPWNGLAAILCGLLPPAPTDCGCRK